MKDLKSTLGDNSMSKVGSPRIWRIWKIIHEMSFTGQKNKGLLKLSFKIATFAIITVFLYGADCVFPGDFYVYLSPDNPTENEDIEATAGYMEPPILYGTYLSCLGEWYRNIEANPDPIDVYSNEYWSSELLPNPVKFSLTSDHYSNGDVITLKFHMEHTDMQGNVHPMGQTVSVTIGSGT